MSRAETTTWVFVGARLLAVGSRQDGHWRGVATAAMPAGGWSMEAMLADLDALIQGHAQSLRPLRPNRLMAIASDAWLAGGSVPWAGAGQATGTQLLKDCLEAAGHEPGGGELVCVEEAPWRSTRAVIAYDPALLAAIRAAGQHLASRSTRCCSLGAAAWAALPTDVRRRCPVLAVLEPEPLPGRARDHDQDAVLVHRATRGDGVGEVVPRRWKSNAATATAGSAAASDALAHLLRRLQWPASAQAPCALVDLHATPQADTLPWPDWVAPTAAAAPLDRASQDLAPQEPSPDGAGEIFLERLAGATRHAGALGVELTRDTRPSPKAMLSALALATAAGLGAGAALHWRDAGAAARQLDAAPRPSVATQAGRPPDAGELRRIAAVNAAVAGLNFPLDQVLQALQPPADIRAGLLAMELTGPALRQPGATHAAPVVLTVRAESPSERDMTRYVAFLGQRERGDVWLRSYEALEQPRAGSVYRYQLELAWAH